tara:strand:+ start:379 stop:546 length:168 start_codon:yes stop_codon:yes gene_type:complete
VLEWENEMRLSPAVQARFREAEMSSERDWIEVAVDVQREVSAFLNNGDKLTYALA